ncbi:hypothetical protein A5750_23235 [Mycobacterium sp. 852002-51613_SCH5001154]|uniref:TIGR02391 family protein n=1 Tax=Mycobacterium sp. 852002-51613_SCH5001154 TaxID=1834104 RepID=UPI0007FE5F25|nr:TIGR02391 family protein [Mycobacterium sp. 852002-51613_SCH5001154]OBF70489.1 hypothetical protein A5750_23235 [Mycobacterium sp. 852002-51613_SCH5001154]
MNHELAHKTLEGVLNTIDHWGDLYERRWGYGHGAVQNDALAQPLKDGIDEVRKRSRLAHDVIAAMGENEIAEKVVEHEEGMYGGHPFTQARVAIVEAMAILTQREELAEVVGPIGPQLSTSELHPAIWSRAARLWDDGHFPESVRSAASALEGLLQAIAGLAVSGADLATLYGLSDPTPGSPRLRLRGIDPDPTSKTWKSAHEGAGSSVRAAFLAVRNLVSHPGWPDPSASEALEMIAVLSYVAHLVDRSDIVKST